MRSSAASASARDAPLDMRMDRSQGPTAAERLREVSEGELADVIFQYGEERHSRRIARALVRARDEAPLDTTGELAAIVRARRCRIAATSASIRRRGRSRRCASGSTASSRGSTRFVRDAACCRLARRRAGWRSSPSTRSRTASSSTRSAALDREPAPCRVLTTRPEIAGDDEVARNPRARSAKLRAAERRRQDGLARSLTMDFEHAIKMDVRNNPIVRELDRRGSASCGGRCSSAALLVAVMLFSLWQRFSVMRAATRSSR